MLGYSLSLFLQKIKKNRKLQGLIFVLLLTATIRANWLITTQDYQGDAWRRIMNMMTLLYHPIWPPGYYYLTKPFYILFGHPELVLRIFSLICGVASVGIAYEVIFGIFGKLELALGTGLLLALFPAHIAYSVQSLSEIPFFFFLLLSFLMIMRRHYYLSAFFLGLASFIRYESWPLLPVFPLYIFLSEIHPIFSGVKNLTDQHKEILLISLRYFGIAIFLPVIYMVLNRISAGYFLWSFSNQNHIPSWDTIALDKVGSLTSVSYRIFQLFLEGFLNIPNLVISDVGPLGHYVGETNQAQWAGLGTVALILILSLSLVAGINSVRLRKPHFVFFIIITIILSGFLFSGLITGSVMPYNRYSVIVLWFLIIISGVGLGTIFTFKKAKIFGTIATLFLIFIFGVLDFYTCYTGPDDPARVAIYVKSLLAPSTFVQRFDRVIGLTGPEQQTLMLKKYLGAPAGKILFAPPFPQVGYISFGSEPLDSYRANMIWALADLSYDEFAEYVITPGQDFVLPPSLPVIILAKDASEDKDPETLIHIRQLLSKRYVMEFSSGALEVWVK